MNKLVIAVAILIVIGLVGFIVMLISTNELMAFAKSVFLGKYDKECAQNKLLQQRYDIISSHQSSHIVNVELTLNRIFILHNFSNGYVWVRYTCKYMDSNNETICSALGIYSKWIIQKQNGVWEVVKIYEKP